MRISIGFVTGFVFAEERALRAKHERWLCVLACKCQNEVPPGTVVDLPRLGVRQQVVWGSSSVDSASASVAPQVVGQEHADPVVTLLDFQNV